MAWGLGDLGTWGLGEPDRAEFGGRVSDLKSETTQPAALRRF